MGNDSNGMTGFPRTAEGFPGGQNRIAPLEQGDLDPAQVQNPFQIAFQPADPCQDNTYRRDVRMGIEVYRNGRDLNAASLDKQKSLPPAPLARASRDAGVDDDLLQPSADVVGTEDFSIRRDDAEQVELRIAWENDFLNDVVPHPLPEGWTGEQVVQRRTSANSLRKAVKIAAPLFDQIRDPLLGRGQLGLDPDQGVFFNIRMQHQGETDQHRENDKGDGY